MLIGDSVFVGDAKDIYKRNNYRSKSAFNLYSMERSTRVHNDTWRPRNVRNRKERNEKLAMKREYFRSHGQRAT